MLRFGASSRSDRRCGTDGSCLLSERPPRGSAGQLHKRCRRTLPGSDLRAGFAQKSGMLLVLEPWRSDTNVQSEDWTIRVDGRIRYYAAWRVWTYWQARTAQLKRRAATIQAVVVVSATPGEGCLEEGRVAFLLRASSGAEPFRLVRVGQRAGRAVSAVWIWAVRQRWPHSGRKSKSGDVTTGCLFVPFHFMVQMSAAGGASGVPGVKRT